MPAEIWLILGLVALLAATVFAIAVTGCLIVAVVAAFARIRRKGYRPFAASAPIIASAVLVIVVTISLLVAGPSDNLLWVFFVVTIAAPGVLVLALFVSVRLLPRRQNRIFGPRRAGSALIAAGWAMIVLLGVPSAVFVLVTQWPKANTVGRKIQVVFAAAVGFVAMSGGGFVLIARGRYSKDQPALESVLAEDQRPPLLYVRPFGREREYFVVGPKTKYGKYQVRFFDSSRTVFISIPFEQYLGPFLRNMVGPLVALGSPEDYLEPIGAARIYAKDQTWKEEFHRLGERAAAILVEVAGSDNVNWEFEYIRQSGWHERLFIFTRHPSAFEKGFARWMADWIQRLKGIPNPSWGEFAENLERIGYHLPPDDPGPGAVITFDTNAQAIVLTRGADLPDEYMAAIRERLATDRGAAL